MRSVSARSWDQWVRIQSAVVLEPEWLPPRFELSIYQGYDPNPSWYASLKLQVPDLLIRVLLNKYYAS